MRTFKVWHVVVILFLLALFLNQANALPLVADSCGVLTNTWPTIKVKAYYTNAGTPSNVVLLATPSGGTEVRADSDNANLASPDTVVSTLTLLANTVYSLRIEVTDADETDTTPAVTATCYALPYPSDWTWMGKGNKKPQGDWLYGGDTYTKSNYSFTSNPLYIGDARKILAKVKLFGVDNNQTFDSACVYLQSNPFGLWTKVDTLVNRDIDTLTRALEGWYMYSFDESLNVASNFKRLIGDSVRITVDITDSVGAAVGDTMTLDGRGFEYQVRKIR